jgi:predicted Rossmann fold flavoprotein
VPLLLSDADPLHRALPGVSHPAELAIWIDGTIARRLTGSLLWTHFGISGPVALNASRHWTRATADGRTCRISVNVAPGQRFETLDAALVTLARERAKTPVSGAIARLIPTLPASAAASLASAARLDTATPVAHLPRDDRRALVRALTESTLPITGTRGYTFAEATAGGVALEDIDPGTMASRRCPELFLVGEMLDVDGRIGGFNFQWAWASGRAAAGALAAG